MKNKLRKIVIDNLDYLYRVTNKYHSEGQTNTMSVRIFLSGQKQTPLIIEFWTTDDPIMGQPLNFGIELTNKLTGATDTVNVNEPKYMRQLILQGREKGWTGNNEMDKQNGLDYLNELGYDTSPITAIK